MRKLTPQGKQIVQDLSFRYNLSHEAVQLMMESVVNGGGTMAQFNIYELGGQGQWMQGGMTMVGDMFNMGLQSTVNNLCNEISNCYYNQTFFIEPKNSFSANWWPKELGQASASGAQNNIRYAYFSQNCRLAVDANGTISIYDTLNHQISGFSQSQGNQSSVVTFTSQFGMISTLNLPLISTNRKLETNDTPVVIEEEIVVKKEAEPTTAVNNKPIIENNDSNSSSQETESTSINKEPNSNSNSESNSDSNNPEEIVELLEKLGDLYKKDILSLEEFNSKKQELLSKL